MAAKSKNEKTKAKPANAAKKVNTRKKATVRKPVVKKVSQKTESVLSTSKTVKRNYRIFQNRTIFFLTGLVAVAGLLYLSRGLIFAAMVNGSPITRLEVVKELEKSSGQQVLDNLVTKEIILQEMRKNNIVITDEDINSEIETIKKSIESQGTTLEQVLSEQGQTMDSLRENIKVQLGVEELFANDIAISDDEVSSYFEENKDYFQDQELEAVEGQLREQLFNQKLSTKYREWLTEKKANSKVQYFVSY